MDYIWVMWRGNRALAWQYAGGYIHAAFAVLCADGKVRGVQRFGDPESIYEWVREIFSTGGGV